MKTRLSSLRRRFAPAHPAALRNWPNPGLSAAFLLLVAGLAARALSAGPPPGKEPAWDVANPGAPLDTLDFESSDGSWICLDLSPDGKTLVFDLLGDLYTMPAAGGEAICVSSGLPYEVQPRWSPDGRKILFTSDRGGGDNLWTMNPDGSGRKQLTHESYRLLNNGVWRPDGRYVVAKKHFTSARSMGAGEMWIYPYPQGGEGVRLTTRRNDQQDAGEPDFSPDGRYLYWSEDMSPGGHFEYNKDPNGTIYVIRRLELQTGEIRDLISLAGGAVRPQISPDGRQLAFVRRIRARSILCLYNLDSGEVRPLWDGLSRDQQETWSLFGVYPGFCWTPDGKAIDISAQGKIWSVDAATGKAKEIPFHAHLREAVQKPVRFPVDVQSDSFDVRVIRWPQLTPDGHTAVFQALGYLYKREIRDGKVFGPPERITPQTEEFEFAPSLTPDGRGVVYTTWSDAGGGRIKLASLDGKNVRTLVDRPGHYPSALLSPDGSKLVYERGSGDGFRGRLWVEEPGIYLLDLTRQQSLGKTRVSGKVSGNVSANVSAKVSGKASAKAAEENPWGRLLTREGRRPRFSQDGQRIYLISRENDKAALVSVDLLGSDRRVHATSERATDFQLSPDEHWLAYEELWQAYVQPFPLWGRPCEIGPESKALPQRRLSQDGGTWLNWSPDGKKINWSLGPDFQSASLEDLFPAGVDSVSSAAAILSDKTDHLHLGWRAASDHPETDLYLVGARLLPMNSDSVIPDAVVHIKGNRIAAAGPRSAIPVPAHARILDLTGRTVLPGFIDVHAHFGSSNQGIYSQENWSMLANLAFGVTTMHDPSNDTQMVFAMSELAHTNQLLAPRIFSTGTILYGAEGDFKTVINKYEDALEAVRRTKAWGAISVKSYNQPRREQRQMVIRAAREEHMLVVPEGGSTLNMDMTLLLDGHTTMEHAIPVAPLYTPELTLLSRFGSGYTPTLIVGYGGIFGENWWYQHTDVWKNERLSHFMPRSRLDPRARRRTMAPEEEYYHLQLAQTAAEVARRGGNVETGAHGQLQGLGFHWELWMLQQGGMTNMQALRAATWNGARALGMDGELGSIQAGKLADLLILDGDPLADIRQTENIAYTMVNGRLYDAHTLEQVEPERRALPPGPPLE